HAGADGDPPHAGADRGPLAAPRPWFAFLPGIAPEGVELGEMAASAGFEGGTVVRTGPLPLERVRAAIAPHLPDGLDVPLYPVTD
ncbi:MAG TPA: hypothetical protein VLM76_02410, partial [Patescibacteria group bacterium]|nr:hypothetical protein [Patescibacteria group bacterium]